MIMDGMLELMEFDQEIRKTSNPIKKLYYLFKIKSCKRKIHKYIYSANLYDLLLEFAISFYFYSIESNDPIFNDIKIYESDYRYRIIMSIDNLKFDIQNIDKNLDSGLSVVYTIIHNTELYNNDLYQRSSTNYHYNLSYDSNNYSENQNIEIFNNSARYMIDKAINSIGQDMFKN